MTIPFQQSLPADVPVLELESAGIDSSPGYDTGMERVSLCLRRGELGMLLLAPGHKNHPLPDAISGLVGLDGGSLRVFGHAWEEYSADSQVLARGRIGRVFGHYSWLSNLDVDENVILSECHHTLRKEADILAEAEAWARMAGLTALPSARPHATPREQLRRAEWVRAAVGERWLVVLERPGRDLLPGWLDQLGPLVARLREKGSAVLWLCEDPNEWDMACLKPSLKLRDEGNTLVAVESA